MQNLNVFDASFKGFSLVEASAGTGKTYNITSLYVRAIVEKKLNPSNILVLTYTEAATAELKSRIRGRIKDCIDYLNEGKGEVDDFISELKNQANDEYISRLKSALFSFDEASIFTIHGFCQKLLREENLAFGVQSDFEIIQDTSELIQDVVDAYWREVVKEYSGTKLGEGLLEFLMSEKINPDELKSVVKQIVAKPYANLLPEHNLDPKVQAKIKSIQRFNEALRSQWEADKDQLNEVVFSGKLNKRSYKAETFKAHWKSLELWISSDKIHFSGFDKIENFGEDKILSSVTKGNQVDVPEFSKILDKFLEEIGDLNEIKANFMQQAISEIKINIESQKEKKNGLSFDDLLQKVEANLDQKLADKISAQYPIALVDEFQDTDPIQYSIFKKIYKEQDAALFMIGDPKQAIYSFRGADLFTYFEATNDVSEEQRYSLNNNYRSNKTLINAVNNVFSRHEQPFVFDEPQFRNADYPEGKKEKILTLSGDKQPPLTFIDCNLEELNADLARETISEYVAGQIQKIITGEYSIEDKPVEPKDISVLVRKKKEAGLIQETLQRFGIKSIARSNESIFKTRECEDLKILLKAVIDHSNSSLVRAALIGSHIGYTSNDILKIMDHESKWAEMINVFRLAYEKWDKYGLLDAINELDQFFHIQENLSKLANAERRITNLTHLKELINEYESKNRATPYSVIRYLNQKIQSTSTPSDEEIIRLESDSDLVNITTLHSSKGLEYPIVFIPFLWDNFDGKSNKGYSILEFHDDENKLQIDIAPEKSDDAHNIAHREALADALRLNYVALTRAEAACFIPFGMYKEVSKSSLSAMISGSQSFLNNSLKKDEKEVQFYSDLKALDDSKLIRVLDSAEILNESSSSSDSENQKDLFSSKNYHAKEFGRTDINEFSRLVSFSSLTSSKTEQAPVKDYDQLEFIDTKVADEAEELQDLSVFSFPKGSSVGNLLHNIYEYIDFKDATNHQQIIDAQFEISGIDPKWKPILEKWIEKGLFHNINDEIKLSEIEPVDVLKELEFHFPVRDINTKKIVSTIHDESAEDVSELSITGFMKGFIDLIFRHRGKYYILDYKSNHLGNSIEDYSSEFLKKKIISSSFDVQYHIYTVALKLYLEQRIPGFDFENNFGGVFYYFLRGIDEPKNGSGVFFDKPSIQVINKLQSELGVIDS